MLTKILDDNLLAEQEARKTKVRSGLWNPSAFGQCYRRQVWNRRNVPQSDPPDIQTLRVFRAGKVFHDMLQQLIPKSQVEVEITVDDVHGFADIVTQNEVIDIKSQNSWAFKLMNKEEFDITRDKPEHLLQVCTYAMLLDKPMARMVYINKDTLEIKEFVVEVEIMASKIWKEIETLKTLWVNEGDPDATPRLYVNKEGASRECEYCQFVTKCKGKSF